MSDWERPSLSASGSGTGRGGPKKKKPQRLRWIFWSVAAVAVVGFGLGLLFWSHATDWHRRLTVDRPSSIGLFAPRSGSR